MGKKLEEKEPKEIKEKNVIKMCENKIDKQRIRETKNKNIVK